MLEHVEQERVQADAWLPAEVGTNACRVGADRPWIGGADERRVDDDRGLAGVGEGGRPGKRAVALKAPGEVEAGERERAVDQLPHRVELPRAEHVVAVRRCNV